MRACVVHIVNGMKTSHLISLGIAVLAALILVPASYADPKNDL